jgi:hypothetical protein
LLFLRLEGWWQWCDRILTWHLVACLSGALWFMLLGLCSDWVPRDFCLLGFFCDVTTLHRSGWKRPRVCVSP